MSTADQTEAARLYQEVMSEIVALQSGQCGQLRMRERDVLAPHVAIRRLSQLGPDLRNFALAMVPKKLGAQRGQPVRTG